MKRSNITEERIGGRSPGIVFHKDKVIPISPTIYGYRRRSEDRWRCSIPDSRKSSLTTAHA